MPNYIKFSKIIRIIISHYIVIYGKVIVLKSKHITEFQSNSSTMKKVYVTIITIFIFSSIACNIEDTTSTTLTPNTPTRKRVQTVVKEKKKPVLSLQAYEAFSKRLEKNINEGKADLFNKHFALNEIVTKIVNSVGAPADYQNGFTTGVKNSLNVGAQIVNSLGVDGEYKFMGIQNYPANPTALFRLVSEDGLNYHEIYLGSRNDKSIAINDFYIYMGGLNFSATLKRVYLSSLSEIKGNLDFSQTSPEDRALVEYIQHIDDIAVHVQKNKYTSAMKAIEKLPTILQKDKMVLIMKLNVAANMGEEKYKQTAQLFKKLYPKDPVVDLMQLDFSFNKHNYEETLGLLTTLGAKVNNDPYLNVMRSNVYVNMNQLDNAEKLLKATIRNEHNEEAYWNLLTLYLNQQKYNDAVALFPPMQQEFDVNPAESLLADGGYGDFLKSKAYKSWERKYPIAMP